MEQDIAVYFWGLKNTVFFDVFSVISGKIYISITCFAFIVYAFAGLKKRALVFLLASILAVGVSDILCYRILKPVIKRPRPAVALDLDGTRDNMSGKPLQKKDYSMPSNHASNIFAFFIVYFLYVRRFWILLFINSILIAMSRIFIVKHYPSDVFAGIFIGILIGICVVCLFSFLGYILEIKYEKILAKAQRR